MWVLPTHRSRSVPGRRSQAGARQPEPCRDGRQAQGDDRAAGDGGARARAADRSWSGSAGRNRRRGPGDTAGTRQPCQRSTSNTMRALTTCTPPSAAGAGIACGAKTAGTISRPATPGTGGACGRNRNAAAAGVAASTSPRRPAGAGRPRNGPPRRTPARFAASTVGPAPRAETRQGAVGAVQERDRHAAQLLPGLGFEAGPVALPVRQPRLGRRLREGGPHGRDDPEPHPQERVVDTVEAALAGAGLAAERRLPADQAHLRERRQRTRQAGGGRTEATRDLAHPGARRLR